MTTPTVGKRSLMKTMVGQTLFAKKLSWLPPMPPRKTRQTHSHPRAADQGGQSSKGTGAKERQREQSGTRQSEKRGSGASKSARPSTVWTRFFRAPWQSDCMRRTSLSALEASSAAQGAGSTAPNASAALLPSAEASSEEAGLSTGFWKGSFLLAMQLGQTVVLQQRGVNVRSADLRCEGSVAVLSRSTLFTGENWVGTPPVLK